MVWFCVCGFEDIYEKQYKYRGLVQWSVSYTHLMYYSQWKIGAVLETHTIMTAWQCVAAAGVLGLILYLVLIKADRKVYPLLYKK